MDLPQKVLKHLTGQWAEALQTNIENARQTLVQCIDQIAKRQESTVSMIGQVLDNLCSSTYREMQDQSVDTSLHATLRQIYTDGCILHALLHLFLTPDDLDDDTWIKCIQKLDGALIFSGAPGRMDIVHALIRHIQIFKLPPTRTSSYQASELPPDPAQISLPPCGKYVPKIDEPDLVAFLTIRCKSPFVIPNGVSHWPALI